MADLKAEYAVVNLYPTPLRGFDRQLRKATKVRLIFPADDSLLKMLHLAMIDLPINELADARAGVWSMHSDRSVSLSG